MSAVLEPVPVADRSRAFLPGFMALAATSGATIGMGKIIVTLHAMQLGATPFQIGVISGMESVGMMLVTVPAGFLIARHGVRTVYFLASLGPMLLYTLLPFTGGWAAMAVIRGLIGLCIPFRIVSMNSSFLQELKTLGPEKAGWYRAGQTLGMAMIGPALAGALVGRVDIAVPFFIVAALFAAMGLFGRAFFPVQAAPSAQAPGSFLRDVGGLLKSRDVRESCLIELVSSSAGSLFGAFILVVAIQGLHLPKDHAIVLLLVQGLTTVSVLLFGSRLFLKFSRGQGYAVSLALALGALTLLGLGHSLWVLGAGAVLLSLGSSLVHFVNMSQLAAHPLDKSKISGLFNLASMSGGVGGAILGGALTRLVPVQSLYLIWIPVLLVTALVVAFSARAGEPGHAV